MKLKLLNIALVSLVLSVSCLTNVANAGLIKNGNIITDTDTGLDWYALTATTGNSYNTMSSLLSDSNSIYFGYEYASFQQLESLWQNAGYITAIAPLVSIGNNTTTNATDILALNNLMGLFGQTGTNCCARSSGIYNAISGNSRLIWDWLPDAGGSGITYTGITTSPSAITWAPRNDIGHWLIKETPTDVPEPSTLAIFALGIIGLASRRFNK